MDGRKRRIDMLVVISTRGTKKNKYRVYHMLGCLEKASEVQGMLGKVIMDAMEDYIAENGENEKADRKVADKVNKVMEAAKELAETLRRKVTVEELAEESKLSEKSIREAVRFSGNNIEYIEEA